MTMQEVTYNNESSSSAISWAAILGGALAGSAFSLILLALGSGIGLASVSPWTSTSGTVATVTVLMVIWMIVVQWISSAFGGYLTGRLRTKWSGVHSDEVFFRDTAHGFLSWAVATVLSVMFVACLTLSAVGGSAKIAAHAASSEQAGDSNSYFIDNLFRKDVPTAEVTDRGAQEETLRILTKGLADGDIKQTDKDYLARLVANRAGISEDDARRRVDETITNVKNATDAARKAGATLALFGFLAMLIGAFVASAAAALGGHDRDRVEPVRT